VARANGPALEIHARLSAAGVDFTPSQLARALSDNLGPLDECADEIAHWRALTRVRVGESNRLPEADIAAMKLAVAGFSCLRLRDAILRLSETTEPPGKDPETTKQLAGEDRSWEVEQSVEEALEPGEVDEKSYGARLTHQFIANSKAAGPVRPEVELSSEEKELEQIGRAQAVLDGFDLKLKGAATSDAIDLEDVSIVVDYPAETVEAALTGFDRVFGDDWLDGGIRYVQEADLDDLVVAVRAANAMAPIFESRVTQLGEGRLRWNAVAIFVPVVLTMVGLLPDKKAPTGRRSMSSQSGLEPWST
jgi:hypothetical protein